MEKRRRQWWAGILLVLVLFFTVSCSSQRVEKENHIHAIAFDPTDPSSFYVATHYFLEKYTDGRKEQIGKYGDDFMGFVIAKDGSFYSSGHSPTVRNVGIRRSTDKGKTWTTLAYEEMDFHDMAVTYANQNVIYAWSTPPENMLTVSKDGGQSWERVETAFSQALYSFSADHQKENTVYVGSLLGLFVSEDYGKTWQAVGSLEDTPILAIADDPSEEGIIYLSAYQRGILQTKDGGKTWSELNVGLPPIDENLVHFLVVNPHDTAEVVVVTKQNEIYKYTKEGEWKLLNLKEDK